MRETKIISAFPACGKTYCFDQQDELGVTILDSDSSQFSWCTVKSGWDSQNQCDKYVKVRNPQFPQNYIDHIRENIGKVDYIFVSSHQEVRQALDDAGIDYCLVFPSQLCKSEWVGRCFLRGSDTIFCRLIADKWDTWINGLYRDSNSHQSFILGPSEYLSDVIESLRSGGTKE